MEAEEKENPSALSTPTKKYAKVQETNKCRLCKKDLYTSGSAYNIFTKKNINNGLQQKIQRICGVSVQPDDPVSIRICPSC